MVQAEGYGRAMIATFGPRAGLLRVLYPTQGFDHCSGDLAEAAPVTPAPAPAAPPPVATGRPDLEVCVLHGDGKTMTCPIPEPVLDPELGEDGI